jgi:hypothetical protein
VPEGSFNWSTPLPLIFLFLFCGQIPGKGYVVKISVGEGKVHKTTKTSSRSTEATFTDPAFSLTIDTPDTDVISFGALIF